MKKTIAMTISLVLLMSLILMAVAAGQPVMASQMPSEKEEIIYGLLEHDGQVRQLTVVNMFGAGDVVDYGRYRTVQNLTSSEPVEQVDDRLSVPNDAAHFSYRGDLEETALPWMIKIQYQLDGQMISAGELAGKSGQLLITVSVSENTQLDPVFFDHYMLQLTLSLDGTTFSEIESPGATIANAGQNKVISHTILPGQGAEIEMSMRVRDCAFNGFEFAALPFSFPFELPDTDPLVDEMVSLSDAVAGLSDGLSQLAAGVAELGQGARDLTAGSEDYADGLAALDRNSAALVQSSEQIQSALQQIGSALAVEDFAGDDLAALAELPRVLQQLAAGLDQLADGMTELQSGFTDAHMALAGAIDAIPDTDINPSELYAAIYGQVQLEEQLGELMRYYGAAKGVQGTYAAVEGAFSGVSYSLIEMRTSIQEIADVMNSMADELLQSLGTIQIVEELAALSQGLTQLQTEYQRFHQGLAGYTDGVHDLAQGYRGIHNGIGGVSEGIDSMAGGASDLADGGRDLTAGVSDLPVRIEEGLTDLMGQYDVAAFVPRSFVSDKNTEVSAVQFVLRTDPVTADSAPDMEPPPPERLNFFQKLLKLFGLLN